MNVHQQAICDRLGEFGWELASCEDLGVWWADETWKLRSVWSPQTCEVFLTFLVDPQTDVYRRKSGQSVWAVKASVKYPARWQQDEGEYVLAFGHGWTDRLPDLFSNLSAMRDMHAA